MAVAQACSGSIPRPAGYGFSPQHPPGAFPYLPGQSGYNKRLRAAVPLLKKAIRLVAADTDPWFDDVRRPTPPRSSAGGPDPR
jgi:hypothetical protein